MNQIDLESAAKLAGCLALMIPSLAMLASGAGLAYVAEVYPGKRAKLEYLGGFMILGGLALLGVTFPSY